MDASNNPGIYIHIPFCQSKCGYCDFYSITDLKLRTHFIQALKKEIEIHAQNHTVKKPFDTIYIGGGTPSLILPSELSEIVEKLYKHLALQTDIEVTLEINPGTVDVNRLKFLRSIGINRLSIGAQSFIDQELRFLGRIHTSIQAEECICFARECGFQNINVDLIYALPDQRLTDWAYSLKKTLLFSPEHIAAYSLIFEEGTPFYASLKKGKFRKLNDNQESEFFEFTHTFLSNSDYHHYEVSNFAKSEETVSKHNCKYWNHVDYLGLGPSAHSFWQNKRWSNVNSLNEYIQKINSDIIPIVFQEELNGKHLMFEYIFLKLRTYRGINLNKFHKLFGKNFYNQYQDKIKMLLEDNWAVLNNGYFKLTQKGMLICDEILLHFV